MDSKHSGILAFQGYGCSKDIAQAAHDDIAVWERNEGSKYCTTHNSQYGFTEISCIASLSA